jgi:hypothetical protein
VHKFLVFSKPPGNGWREGVIPVGHLSVNARCCWDIDRPPLAVQSGRRDAIWKWLRRMLVMKWIWIPVLVVGGIVSFTLSFGAQGALAVVLMFGGVIAWAIPVAVSIVRMVRRDREHAAYFGKNQGRPDELADRAARSTAFDNEFNNRP